MLGAGTGKRDDAPPCLRLTLDLGSLDPWSQRHPRPGQVLNVFSRSPRKCHPWARGSAPPGRLSQPVAQAPPRGVGENFSFSFLAYLNCPVFLRLIRSTIPHHLKKTIGGGGGGGGLGGSWVEHPTLELRVMSSDLASDTQCGTYLKKIFFNTSGSFGFPFTSVSQTPVMEPH